MNDKAVYRTAPAIPGLLNINPVLNKTIVSGWLFDTRLNIEIYSVASLGSMNLMLDTRISVHPPGIWTLSRSWYPPPWIVKD